MWQRRSSKRSSCDKIVADDKSAEMGAISRNGSILSPTLMRRSNQKIDRGRVGEGNDDVREIVSTIFFCVFVPGSYTHMYLFQKVFVSKKIVINKL